MKAFYRLLNVELGELLRGVLLLSGAVIAASLILIAAQVKGFTAYSVQERFEDIYAASGMPIVFFVSVLLLLALFVKSIYQAYWGSKSIYTRLTLPVRRELLYVSKLCAFLISFYTLLCAQLVGFVLSYSYVSSRIKAVIEESVRMQSIPGSAYIEQDVYQMTNGLFLAFLRSDFMGLLWPSSALNMLSTFSFVLVLVTGVYYWSLCERSERKWGWCFLPLVVWQFIHIIGMRLHPIDEYSTIKVAISTVLLLIVSVIFIWHSIYLLKKGAIA